MKYSLCNPHPRWLRQEPVLVGSRAIHFWFPDFRRGADEGCDWDWLSATECDQPWRMDNDDVHEVFVDERIGRWHWGDPIATPDELYTLKLSHMFWEVNGSTQNWNKHAYDAIYLSRKGCKFLPELYEILYPIWKEVHGGRKAKLRAASKEGFFKDAVVRKYDHDSLHRSVALAADGVPMYEKILKPGSEVDCSWELFEGLTLDEQLDLCREEIYVTALERILVPRDLRADARMAYHWSLRRVLTSLFVNKWALFVALHLDELLIPKHDYRALHRANADKLILMEDPQ